MGIQTNNGLSSNEGIQFESKIKENINIIDIGQVEEEIES